MTGYIFVYGVDGFGEDTAPAYEEGVFLDCEKAWAHFKDLTERQLKETNRKFYERGYEEEETHILHDLDEICERINDYDDPPFGFYQMIEIEIIE